MPARLKLVSSLSHLSAVLVMAMTPDDLPGAFDGWSDEQRAAHVALLAAADPLEASASAIDRANAEDEGAERADAKSQRTEETDLTDDDMMGIEKPSPKSKAKAKAKTMPAKRQKPEELPPAEPPHPLCVTRNLPAVPSMALALASSIPLCQLCGWECDPLRSQIKTKGVAKFTCNICNCKQSALSRRLGPMPPEFKSLSDDDKQEFWRSAKGCATGDQVKETFVNTLIKKRVDAVCAKISGTYLPLSVYEKQGFPIDEIEAKCKDTQDHPILGLCYRVSLHSLERTSLEAAEREQVMKLLDRPRPSIAPAAGDAKGAAPDEAKDAASESEDDESSSSSSSDSEKKSKKKKKKSKASKKVKKDKKDKKDEKDDKKDKKGTKGRKDKVDAMKNEEKANKAKMKVANNKIQLFASRLMAKIAHPLFVLDKELQNPLINKVAKFAVDACKKTLKDLQTMRDQCMAAQSADIAGPPMAELGWTAEGAAEVCKSALTHASVVQNMLVAAKAHFG